MKAISVREPWATAIMRLGKTVENRARKPPERLLQRIAMEGPQRIALHASKTTDVGWYERHAHPASAWVDLVHASLDFRCRGAILGTVLLTGCHSAWRTMTHDGFCCGSPWAQWDATDGSGLWHLTLAEPLLLPEPAPCAGALGFWSVEGRAGRGLLTALESLS